ncbi:hypothetical protein EVJ27_06545 [Exiguobacterium sp. SH3S2]|uniref:hypothetical protein n=1 Tax=unclassified Exiguobacterium TaxID=2644629 RepID=UPI00103E7997|nr:MULTISPECIES: hypothetical protein [unclassified Exiguobacterium]TCI46143.1 hypothetical protein EVJ28_06540 [Exiguobacterium sp. SH3S3]TCI61231.1 hypothetical protein EVJ27_06545 [Exiguobacterium sp. SH3S2]
MKIEVIEDPRFIGDLHYYVHVENEYQMELFLEDVPPNSKKLIRNEGRFYDYLLEEWTDVKGSIEVFNNLNLGIHREDKWSKD